MRAPRLKPVLDAFSPQDLRDWADGLGQATFVGTSGRVFPEAMKASPLLRAWLAAPRRPRASRSRRARAGSAGPPAARSASPRRTARSARSRRARPSWRSAAHPGRDSARTAHGHRSSRPRASPSRPCARPTAASPSPGRPSCATASPATPLKRIALDLRRAAGPRRGRHHPAGLEGGAVYALVPAIRVGAVRGRHRAPTLDLRPDETRGGPRGAADAPAPRRLPVDPSAQEPEPRAGRRRPAARRRRRRPPIPIVPGAPHQGRAAHGRRAFGGLERAISTAGGVAFDALDEHFMLRARPGVFVAGEMLDWEAPTGGYLLQACFATGVAAAWGALVLPRRQGARRRYIGRITERIDSSLSV